MAGPRIALGLYELMKLARSLDLAARSDRVSPATASEDDEIHVAYPIEE
jgi:hypothetical protein